MSEDVEASFALPRRPYWQSAGFAVGCAERLLPMAASLGGHRIAETTEPGLALAWKAAAGPAGRSEIEQAITALTDAIYNAADDGFELLGAHAANVTVFALEAVSESTREGWVSLARVGALDLVQEVDFELAMPPEAALTLTFSDQDAIPDGPLKRAEIGAQQTSLDLLDVGYAPDAQALEAVRRLSRLRAEELARALPEFARRRGQRYEELERRRAARLAEIARRQDRKPP
jgi:hypothetical protein